MDTSVKEKTVARNKKKIVEPSFYDVIYINDDITTIQFVVETLIDIFGYEFNQAELKASEIHENGRSVIGTYTYEIAEQKGVEVIQRARKDGFPLQVRIEPVTA